MSPTTQIWSWVASSMSRNSTNRASEWVNSEYRRSLVRCRSLMIPMRIVVGASESPAHAHLPAMGCGRDAELERRGASGLGLTAAHVEQVPDDQAGAGRGQHAAT